MQKMRLLSKAVQPVEKHGGQPTHFKYRYSPALAYLLINQLSKLNRYTMKRRDIATRYEQGGLSLTTELAGGIHPSWLRYPLQVKNPKALHSKAKQNKILLGNWYNAPLAPPDSNPESFDYKPGSCPVAEKVSRRIINLPTYPTMNKEEVSKIVKLVLPLIRGS